MPKRSEVERLLDAYMSTTVRKDEWDEWRALFRAAERMRGEMSADRDSSIRAYKSARAYDRAKKRIIG